jgi:hypothetical protein
MFAEKVCRSGRVCTLILKMEATVFLKFYVLLTVRLDICV